MAVLMTHRGIDIYRTDGDVIDTLVLLSTAEKARKVLLTHLYCYQLLIEVLMTHQKRNI